jgi:hypothetical protein
VILKALQVSFEEDNASATGTHKAYDEWIKNGEYIDATTETSLIYQRQLLLTA